MQLRWQANPLQIRELKSDNMARLVKVPGIVVSCSGLRAKATRITIRCRSCNNTIPNIPVKPGLDGYIIPKVCPTENIGGRDKCPFDPFFIVPDKCKCVDFQVNY